MNLTPDSVETFIISAVIGLATLFLGAVVALVGWGLKEVGTKLVTTLTETLAHVQILDAKLAKVVEIIGDVDKLRSDVNVYYKRLKDLEKEVRSSTDA